MGKDFRSIIKSPLYRMDQKMIGKKIVWITTRSDPHRNALPMGASTYQLRV
jgi:flavin reductase (DIM6/NTAB) family NADH-FMN oxidoreductase RutF